MINIELTPNMSLKDVKDAADSGVSVMRSAHVGNHRAYNLAIANLGIPMLLVDHTIVSQFPEQKGDANYLPGSIVTQEGITPLYVNGVGRLAMQASITTPEDGRTMFVDEFHKQNLQTVFPDTPIFTNSEYIRDNEDIASAVLKIAIQEMPELFTRAIESDGTIRRKSEGDFSALIDSYGILQLSDDPHRSKGLLIPNDVDIVLNFIVEALLSEKDTQIHLSGPDMKQYMKDPSRISRINQLYECVRRVAHFGNQLPETLTVKLLPADEARFASTASSAESLEQLSQLLAEEAALAIEAQEFFQSEESNDTSQKRSFLAKKTLVAKSITQALRDLNPSLARFLIGSKEAPFMSQYDLLAGNQLFVMAENYTLSMTALKGLTQRIKKGSP